MVNQACRDKSARTKVVAGIVASETQFGASKKQVSKCLLKKLDFDS